MKNKVFNQAPKEANKYVSGIAVHWYMDFLIPPNALDLAHDAFPDKFIFATYDDKNIFYFFFINILA